MTNKPIRLITTCLLLIFDHWIPGLAHLPPFASSTHSVPVGDHRPGQCISGETSPFIQLILPHLSFSFFLSYCALPPIRCVSHPNSHNQRKIKHHLLLKPNQLAHDPFDSLLFDDPVPPICISSSAFQTFPNICWSFKHVIPGTRSA